MGGANTGEPREKPPDTPASVEHVPRVGLEPTPDTAVRVATYNCALVYTCTCTFRYCWIGRTFSGAHCNKFCYTCHEFLKWYHCLYDL